MRVSTWLLMLSVATSAALAGEPDLFERDVAPLLVRHCLDCHNASEQAGGLDLSTRHTALAGGDSQTPAWIAANIEESHLLERIRTGEMPPPGKGPVVPADDLTRLEAWIAAGAAWPDGRRLSAFEMTTDLRAGLDWWSLQPPRRTPSPRVANTAWPRTPIDAFVLARLEAAGLAPNPDADRATFIRRAMLDLHGLPPTPEEISRFVADDAPDAYERLVDRLLSSPRYGERWARHWLDVVRFGESDGYEKNLPRAAAWPYRDWVIAALNDDLPYTEFILRQLAGDQVGADAATGFLVGGTHDEVSSPDLELTLNQRANDLDDMLSTTSTAFLGLTVNCAKCHDHKFDPISQRDYYSLQAMFAGVQHGARELRTSDSDARRRQADVLRDRLRQVERQVDELSTRHQPLASLEPASDRPLRPAVHARLNIDRFAPVLVRFVRFTVQVTNSFEPCLDELEIYSAEPEPRNLALASSGAKATASSTYAGGTSKIHRLEHIHDGQYGNSRSWISAEAGSGWVQIELAEPALVDRVVWARDREGKYADRLPTQYRIEVSETGEDWQRVASADDRHAFDAEANRAVPGRATGLPPEIAEQVEDLERQMAELRAQIEALAPAMAYLGTFREPEATHVYHRGDPLQPREAVLPAGVAAVDPPLTLPADTPEAQRRLALARWLGSEANPLTARVLVNRVWYHHFGAGLVSTPSDFGFGGGRPSHPELLDYLAMEFMDSGWRLKSVHRAIMLSSTYRQSSLLQAEAAAVDASARLLWRFPPRRLEAEPIRDRMLSTSGVLMLSMGGPGYSPFEPNDNYVRVYAPKKNFGPADWRRMVYQEKPRSRQDGTFGEFDCPDATQTVGRRNVSTTALQALNLLNASFVVQQAELFAERLTREAGTPAEQIQRAFWLAYGRPPDTEELAAAETLVREHGLAIFCRALYNSNEFLYLN